MDIYIHHSHRSSFLKALEKTPEINPEIESYTLEKDIENQRFNLSVEEKTDAAFKRLISSKELECFYEEEVEYELADFLLGNRALMHRAYRYREEKREVLDTLKNFYERFSKIFNEDSPNNKSY